jgi:hypothetical protein
MDANQIAAMQDHFGHACGKGELVEELVSSPKHSAAGPETAMRKTPGVASLRTDDEALREKIRLQM